jgi:hypothetical protein
MPFTGRPIDPNDLDLMRAAFNNVCDRLELECRREDPLTELVVDAIIDIAAAGERDPDGVLFRLGFRGGLQPLALIRSYRLPACVGDLHPKHFPPGRRRWCASVPTWQARRSPARMTV